MDTAISAARWVVGKALGPVTDGLLESWAASTELGPNIDDLKMELLYAQGMLNNTLGREIHNPALNELLHKLRQLAYRADDALDELDYFRIQDALDGTYDAATVDARGGIHGLALNARHVAKNIKGKLKFRSSSGDASQGDSDDQLDGGNQGCLFGVSSCGGRGISSSPPSPTNEGVQEVGRGCISTVAASARSVALGCGPRFLCGASSSKTRERSPTVQTTKLEFDRVEMSNRIMDIVNQLKPVCAKVSTILNLELLGFSHTPAQHIAVHRPETTPEIIEPELYGRDDQKRIIIDSITRGEYCAKELTVLPIVGPGGIGKTTFTQHIFEEVKIHFQVMVWVCVSLDFNANRLTKEIVKKIPEVNDENKNASEQELIEQRLKHKSFLLVLDDMWAYHEDEWKKLLAPFCKCGEKGNVILVTTRIPEVAKMVKTTDCFIELGRLGDEDFMCFFEACVFGHQKSWKDHPELLDVGRKIVGNLKGFPLAAKTVGRLLRSQLTLGHWTRVEESKEWKLKTNDDDIMPALMLSYEYLPFHLQRCFSYCALFPEDYEFGSQELIHLWLGLDILHSRDGNKRIDDIGQSYLNDLVNHGFFKLDKNKDGCPYYVIHDLLHELAAKVSSYECVTIYSSTLRSMRIPPSIRHLSIIVEDTDVKDRTTFDEYKNDLSALDKRVNMENLRTLMLFGECHGTFLKTLAHLFTEARSLRAIFLSKASYNVEDMFQNFSKLIHLRYLRISSVDVNELCLPGALFRLLYHMEVIDLQEWAGLFRATREISNLVKLCHFIVPEDKDQVHSDIFEVGKLKILKELRRFEVGKEHIGFELSQLGELTELGGSLSICNLEKVQAKEDAKELKLVNKKHLHKLTLEWDSNRSHENPSLEENVLETLVPHGNLQTLCIRGHGGATCPSWLGRDLFVKNLESLSLYDVAWNNFPPLGEIRVVGEEGDVLRGCISRPSFQIFRTLELVGIPTLKKWFGNDMCHLFSHMEILCIKECPELIELSFTHLACCQAKQAENMTLFPRLRELKIKKCPKLSSLPPIPWAHAPCSTTIAQVGSGFEEFLYGKYYNSKLWPCLDTEF